MISSNIATASSHVGAAAVVCTQLRGKVTLSDPVEVREVVYVMSALKVNVPLVALEFTLTISLGQSGFGDATGAEHELVTDHDPTMLPPHAPTLQVPPPPPLLLHPRSVAAKAAHKAF
jgi:hypothetical protein